VYLVSQDNNSFQWRAFVTAVMNHRVS